MYLMLYMVDLVKTIHSIDFRDLGIKYTHSGVISSMLSMDKEISKNISKK